MNVAQPNIVHGDAFDYLRAASAASFDAIITDPPYGLAFMASDWDSFVSTVQFRNWTTEWLSLARTAIRPGGHIAMFGSPRLFGHQLVALEDAGWEPRDVLCWLYGQGFPKSRNLGNGYGTALKPAWEPIILARKPFPYAVTDNFQRYGLGGLNIDAARIPLNGDAPVVRCDCGSYESRGGHFGVATGVNTMCANCGKYPPTSGNDDAGRWPANVVLDEDAAEMLDSEFDTPPTGIAWRPVDGSGHEVTSYDVSGLTEDHAVVSRQRRAIEGRATGPSRFFYTAKASRSEREAGLQGLPPMRRSDGRSADSDHPRLRTSSRRNHHPTVKPLSLARWLTRMVAPPGSRILDPFVGSGTMSIAGYLEGCDAIGVDADADYVTIAKARIAHSCAQGKML